MPMSGRSASASWFAATDAGAASPAATSVNETSRFTNRVGRTWDLPSRPRLTTSVASADHRLEYDPHPIACRPAGSGLGLDTKERGEPLAVRLSEVDLTYYVPKASFSTRD